MSLRPACTHASHTSRTQQTAGVCVSQLANSQVTAKTKCTSGLWETSFLKRSPPVPHVALRANIPCRPIKFHQNVLKCVEMESTHTHTHFIRSFFFKLFLMTHILGPVLHHLCHLWLQQCSFVFKVSASNSAEAVKL